MERNLTMVVYGSAPSRTTVEFSMRNPSPLLNPMPSTNGTTLSLSGWKMAQVTILLESPVPVVRPSCDGDREMCWWFAT